ncbi:Diphthamide-ammonia_ligase [Hexamita inflata]|nr:Diphthamide-ammonia ligase [Hexamita inflata]
MKNKIQQLISDSLLNQSYKTLFIQTSVYEHFEVVQQLHDEFVAQLRVVLSCNTSHKCTSIVDALHFDNPLIIHIEPECICFLQNKQMQNIVYLTSSGEHLVESSFITKHILNQKMPFFYSTKQRIANNVNETEQLQIIAKTEQRLRTRYCASKELEQIGVILGDTFTETKNTALKVMKELKEKNVKTQLFYFGPRIDEAKLLNVETYTKFVLISSCATLNTPWLNSSYSRIGKSVELISMFELQCQLGKVEYCYEYENDGQW